MIFSPATRCLICRATFAQRSASSSILAAARSLARAPRPLALRRAVAARRRASLTDRSSSSLGLLGQRDNLGLRLPAAATDRAGDRAQLAAHRARAVAHPRPLCRAVRPVCVPPRQRADAVRSQARVGWVLDAGLDHRRIDPDRPRPEAPLTNRRLDQLAASSPPRSAASACGRSTRRTPAPRARSGRSGADESSLRTPQPAIGPPAVAVLAHHQPHIRLDRQRRTPIRPPTHPTAWPRAASTPRTAPAAPDRTTARPAPRDRAAAAHLDRQRHVPQRLRLRGHQPQHRPPLSLSPETCPYAGIF